MKNYKYRAFFAAILLSISCKTPNDIKPELPAVSVNEEIRNPVRSFALTVPLINNLTAGNAKIYSLGTLGTDVMYYTDRSYKISSVPLSLTGLTFIRTACDDKTNTSDLSITFNLNKGATLYIAYDQRAKILPAWLSKWEKLPDKIGVTDAAGSLDLYCKDFAAGNVVLGGNMATPAKGATCGYIVAAKPNALTVGVNGHSLGLVAYAATSAAQQVSILRKMGMRAYRQDVLLNSDGSVSSSDKFDQLYKAATDSGITILPMISAQTFNFNRTETQLLTLGKSFGINVATKNAKYFKYYELANELDNLCILPGTDGNKITDYDAIKFKKVAAYLKGMDIGIKLIQPSAQTMVNAGWLHYAFLQMLESYGVNFDIIAYHWYSDMESGAKGKNIPDITLKLSSIFTKPIWFTEAGQRYKSVNDLEQTQSDFILSFIKKCKANPQVEGLLFYELFDEPGRSDAEGNFGFIKWIAPYSSWSYKKAARNLFVY